MSKTAIGFPDKFSMVKCAAESIKSAIAFASVKTKLIVILDGCSSEYEALFTTLFSEGVDLEIVKTPSILNRATYGKQIDLLLKEDAEYVYFSEDDYIYRHDAFAAMMDAIKTHGADFVTPLDHPDNYKTENPPKQKSADILVTRFGHWSKSSSTCLTFMTTAKVLKRTEKVLRYFVEVGEEGGQWLTLTKYGVFNPYLLFVAALLFVFKRKTTGEDYRRMMPLIAWKHSKLRVLSIPRCTLLRPLPSLAVHCSTESLPILSEQIMMAANQTVGENFQTTEHNYLNLKLLTLGREVEYSS